MTYIPAQVVPAQLKKIPLQLLTTKSTVRQLYKIKIPARIVPVMQTRLKETNFERTSKT